MLNAEGDFVILLNYKWVPE